MPLIGRRAFLLGLASLAAGLSGGAQAAVPRLGPPEPFSWEGLVAQARARAARPYAPRPIPAPAILDRLDYVAHRAIRHPAANGLFAERPGASPVTLFHLGTLFRSPVRILALENGIAREALYDPALFTYPPGSPAAEMPPGAGFAGFRVHDPLHDPAATPGVEPDDWLAFLGASYFRQAGDLRQYGVSARGIAIDVAASAPEEFPAFVAFWVEPFAQGRGRVYALLDGPSVTGAYRFDLRARPASTDVACEVFLRRDVERLGFGVCTSMFWYAPTTRWDGHDWRPSVHDSDGLLLRTGRDEWIWRPLVNPPGAFMSIFSDASPRGFGLVQRERALESYLDTTVRYERRPNLWVEPLGDWGRGSVQLLEFGTRSEFEDNIAAFWTPAAPARAGNAYSLAYRLTWSVEDPLPDGLGRVTAARFNLGERLPDGSVQRFLGADFRGAPLASVPPDRLRAEVTASRGTVSDVVIEALDADRTWLQVHHQLVTTGAAPVDVTTRLIGPNGPVAETLVRQLHPDDRLRTR